MRRLAAVPWEASPDKITLLIVFNSFILSNSFISFKCRPLSSLSDLRVQKALDMGADLL